MGLLDVIKSDFEHTIKTTTESEKKAAADYESFKQESLATKKAMETSIENLSDDISSLENSIATGLDDLKAIQGRLDGAIQELIDLNPMCVDSGMTHQQRTEKREAEMKALLGVACWHRYQVAISEFYKFIGKHAQGLPAADQTWKLSLFAVRADCQGRGIGAAVMRQLFAERVEPLQARGISVRIDLMSQMERNLTFYRRVGFEETEFTRIQAKSEWGDVDIPNWAMSKTYQADAVTGDGSESADGPVAKQACL